MQNQTTHHKGKQEERQVGRQAGRHEGRQAGRQRRQNLGKADTPSNTGKKRETIGDKGETRPRESGRTIQHRSHVGRQWETNGDKTSGRRAQHPTQAHVWGDNGGQGLLKADMIQGGDTIQHRHQCGETMGDKTSEGGHTIQHRHTCGRQWETMAHNRRQGETGRQEGRQWKTIRGTIRKWKTSGDKTSGRRTHHPRGNKTSGRRTHQPTQADKGTQDRGISDGTPKSYSSRMSACGFGKCNVH